LANYEYNLEYLNLNKPNREATSINNYFKAPSKQGSKAFDDLNKLEKEAEDLKQEFKNSFINKTNINENKNVSPVFSEYNLWNLQNKEAQSHTSNLEKSIVNALFEKLKDANLFNNNNVNSKPNNIDSIDERDRHKESSTYMNSGRNNNNNNNKLDFKNTVGKTTEKISADNDNKKSNSEFNNSGKNYEKDEFISVDKLYETPMFNKDNQNIYSNFKKELCLNDNNNFNNNTDIETSDFNYNNNNNKNKSNTNHNNNNNNDNNDSNTVQRNKEIEKLQNELEKIKNNHAQNIQNNQKNHSGINSKSKNNISIIDNYNATGTPDQYNNNINSNKSNRESDYNEISVGNITSSYDWELESNRKDRKDEKSKNTNNNNMISKVDNKHVAHNSKNNLNTNSTAAAKSKKQKDIKDKSSPVAVYNSNPIENSIKKISSIKEESDEQEKENISSFDDNSKNKISQVNANSGKKENYFNSNARKPNINNNNKNNNLSNLSNQKTKKKNLSANNNNNSNQKTPGNNKSTSYVNNMTNKSNSYGDFDNTENLEGLNLKNSFNNKFSNVNFDLDRKEYEEEIKSENPSENYGDDFIEDVDHIDNKIHRISFDLDAIKNVSNNFTATNISYLMKDNFRNNSKSNEKDENKTNTNNNNSNKNNYEKFYQSKNSNDDGAIEGKLNFFLYSESG